MSLELLEACLRSLFVRRIDVPIAPTIEFKDYLPVALIKYDLLLIVVRRESHCHIEASLLVKDEILRQVRIYDDSSHLYVPPTD